MKKIFFFLLLLPVGLIAQKNSLYEKALPHTIHIGSIHADSIRLTRNDTMTVITNTGWMIVGWFYKTAPLIYPQIDDKYRWEREWEKVMKGVAIPY